MAHLLFADDCVIFGRVKIEEWKTLYNILGIYERASGQCLNSQKITMFFSSNIDRAERALIQKDVGAKLGNSYVKYLDLPTVVS